MQHFRVESTVRVRHEGPSHSEHTRIALQVTRGKLGQFSIVAGRQVVTDLAELFIDDVEVIDQPFGCWRNYMLLLNRSGNDPVAVQEHTAVLQDAGKERPARTRFAGDDLRSRETFSVLLEALDAEELGADRLFYVGEDDGGWLGRVHRVLKSTTNSSCSPCRSLATGCIQSRRTCGERWPPARHSIQNAQSH